MGLELLAQQTGIKIVHVPYRASVRRRRRSSPARCSSSTTTSRPSLEHVKAGKIDGARHRRSQAPAGPARHSDRRRDRAGLRVLGVDRHLSFRPRPRRRSSTRLSKEIADFLEDPSTKKYFTEAVHHRELQGRRTNSPPTSSPNSPSGMASSKSAGKLKRVTADRTMYNLHLSAEQLEFRDTVRGFVEDEVKPVALKADRLDARDRTLPMDVLDKASQMGLRTLALPEELGGVGADALTCCLVTEELAAGDADVAAVLAETSALAGALFAAMTTAQRERFLRGVPRRTTAITSPRRPRAGHRHRARHQLSPPRRRRAPRARPRRRAAATTGSSTASRTASPTRRSPS